MADLRAQDSSPFVYDTKTVGEIKASSLSGWSVEMIENTSKGSNVKSYRAGLVDVGTWNLSLALDPADAAQAQFLGFLTGSAASVTTAKAYSMALSGSTDRKIVGSGSVASFDIDSSEGSALITATTTIQNSIAPTITTA